VSDPRSRLLPFLLILPAIAYFAIFFAFPLGQGVSLAFTGREGQFTLDNFGEMLGDVTFRSAIVNTLILSATIIPIQLALALVMALLVSSRLLGTSAFLYVAAIPIAISEIAAGIIWLSMFNNTGFINSFLFSIGLIDRPFIFLSYLVPEWLFTSVVLTEIWRATAIVMIILVAGLQAIRKDYLDAADVFGASRFQRFRHVVLPLLRPTIQTALIIRTVLAFQLFATVLVLAGELLPVLALETYLIYTNIRDVHLASAYGLVIMALSTIFVLFYLFVLRTRWRP
jgi:multiple sugar transport system permease protein